MKEIVRQIFGDEEAEDKDIVSFYESVQRDVYDDCIKEKCLALLEYMANKGVVCCMDSEGSYFKVRGEQLTKEQLFENFL